MVTYLVQVSHSNWMGFTTCGARSVSTGDTMRATVVAAATATVPTSTFRHRAETGRPSGKRWGSTGIVKK